MVNLEALAKLAQEATPGPWHREKEHPSHHVFDIRTEDDGLVASMVYPLDAAFIAAASPDVVLVLVRVALAAKALTYPALHSWACVDSESGCVCRNADLRAALRDLDR